MNIKIEHLTPEAYEMLEIMWSMQNYDDLTEFRKNLDADELKLSKTCEQLILQAVVDSLLEDTTDFSDMDVSEVLAKYRTNN